MKGELLPCPFCGSRAKAYESGSAFEVEIRCENKSCNAYQRGLVLPEKGESCTQAYARAYQIAKGKWNSRQKVLF